MVAAIAAILAVLSSSAQAQSARLRVDGLSKLDNKASRTVEVTLDAAMLRLAGKFPSSDRSPDEATVKDIVASLKGVYVQAYEFDEDGAYSQGDLEPIRSQLQGAGWFRVAGVTCKQGAKKEDFEVFVMTDGDSIGGLAAIVSGARDVAVINILGPVDVKKLAELCGRFGIPKLEIALGGER